ncbi:bifunctional metallophosphatase/5'-nucleotidase [Saccharicrinis sp. FJH62]|uniref:bifunctional metallophosphatase/5'-nucleotidase n=1 Tax=Saccharicrinis sp. FJH62 TaxID=3344657 RepID=UPI0035D4FA80
MKFRYLCTIIVLFSLICFPLFSQTITILHTNDMHAHILEEKSPDGTLTGGFAQISALIEKEKHNTDHPVFVADAGDFLMGTLFQMIEMESGFQLNLMKVMGYDAVSVGNHEFDFGVKPFVDYARKASALGCPSLVLANIDYAANKNDEGLAGLYRDSIVTPYTIVEKDGVKVGFFGILGDIAYDYTPNLYAYKLQNRIKTAKKIVKILKEEHQVDFIICLSHSGVYKNEKGEWDMSEDIELATKTEGIDAIISGHTHTRLDQPLIYNGTPIVQTGAYGKGIGKLTLVKNNPSELKYELIPVTGERGENGMVETKIESQFTHLKDTLQKYVGIDYNKKILETAFPLQYMDEEPAKSNIAPLIADAIQYNVNRKDGTGTDISLIAQGMIRSGLDPGSYALPQIFSVASLGEGNDKVPGYALSRMYFTAHEIKTVLEMLEMMAKNDPTYFIHTSGMKIVRNEDGGFFKKIAAIKMPDQNGIFKAIDLSKKNKKLYAVTADTYMMRNLSLIKKKSFGLLKVIPKMEDGMSVVDINATIIDGDKIKPGVQEIKVWKSLIEYAGSFKDVDGNGIPDVPVKYKWNNN